MKRTPEMERLLRRVASSNQKLLEAAIRAEVMELLRNDLGVRHAVVDIVKGGIARGVVKVPR